MPKPQWVTKNSIGTNSTASSVQLYARIRRLLLDYVGPDEADRLADYLDGERVYVWAPPEPAPFPYLTLRLMRTGTPGFNGYREDAELEVQCIGRPESQLPLVESAMDLVDQCLTGLTDAAAGLVVGRQRTRQTVPRFTEPADDAVVAVQATYTLFLWPQVLTTRAT